MTVTYHRLVQRDLNRILKEYDRTSRRLGDDLWMEFTSLIAIVSQTPGKFHFDENSGLHRVNLARFPYHFLYELKPDKVRIIVFRHNKRNPKFGTKRG